MKKFTMSLLTVGALVSAGTGVFACGADAQTSQRSGQQSAVAQSFQAASDANTAKYFSKVGNAVNSALATSAGSKVVTNMDPNLKTALNANDFHRPASTDITVADMETLESIDISGDSVKSLEGLQYATHLISIAMAANNVSDYTPLKNLHLVNFAHSNFAGSEVSMDAINEGLVGSQNSLQHLDIDRIPLKSFSQISQYKNLKSVLAGGVGVSDLSPLTALHQLVFINLGANNITDISPLKSLVLNHSLVGADLSFNKNLSDLSAFAGSKTLQLLRVPGDSVTDLSPISQDTGMGELQVEANSGISTVAPLTGFKNITLLEISDTKVSDITPVATMTSLQGLEINDLPINGDISMLSSLKNLQLFGGDQDNISDVSVMKNWPMLAQLHQLPTGLGLEGDNVWDFSSITQGASDKLIGGADQELVSKTQDVKNGTSEIVIHNPQLPKDRYGKDLLPKADTDQYTYNATNNTLTFHHVATGAKNLTWNFEFSAPDTYGDEYSGNVSIPLHWTA